jgi:hypothetical protein
MHFRFLSFLLFLSIAASAQLKSYRLGDKGDTLNVVDLKGQKQGKWSVRMPALRGESAYEEEGIYLNDRKEGTWMRYNLMGDPLAVENYRWGNKNGICRYFTVLGIEREESWRAINPDKGFDTIEVRDPVNNKYEQVVVKNEGSSLKHGTWKYFDPTKGRMLHTESYFLDKIRDPNDPDPVTGIVKVAAADTTKAKPAEKPKPKEVMDFEKKTSGKKKAVRSGSTGGG